MHECSKIFRWYISIKIIFKVQKETLLGNFFYNSLYIKIPKCLRFLLNININKNITNGTYIYIYIYIHTRVCVCIYIYICIHIHTIRSLNHWELTMAHKIREISFKSYFTLDYFLKVLLELIFIHWERQYIFSILYSINWSVMRENNNFIGDQLGHKEIVGCYPV